MRKLPNQPHPGEAYALIYGTVVMECRAQLGAYREQTHEAGSLLKSMHDTAASYIGASLPNRTVVLSGVVLSPLLHYLPGLRILQARHEGMEGTDAKVATVPWGSA